MKKCWSSKLTIAAHNSADETSVDRFALSLLLNQLQNGIRHRMIQGGEEHLPPGDQSQLKGEEHTWLD